MKFYRAYRAINDYLYDRFTPAELYEIWANFVAGFLALVFGAASLWVIFEVKP